jgi:dienelactone hydrolase
VEGRIPKITDPRFGQLPGALRDRAVVARLGAEATPFADGGVPVLLAHPELGWEGPGARPAPRPVVIWMHGRTVSKELDPGRYLRWIRAGGGGIAACAMDLPWHGERADEGKQGPEWTLRMIERVMVELDLVIEGLGDARWNGAFDLTRIGIGGMSAGGMATLVRLCKAHTFTCAAVEATAGDFGPMRGRSFYVPELVERMNPIEHLDGWRPIPLLALHSRADKWVPVACIENFTAALHRRYAELGADPGMVELVMWDRTGAPEEHMGFGEKSNEAKNLQTEFFKRWLAG